MEFNEADWSAKILLDIYPIWSYLRGLTKGEENDEDNDTRSNRVLSYSSSAQNSRSDIMVKNNYLNSMNSEQFVKDAQKEESSNVVYTCGDCGKDTYFAIKALERKRSMRDYVYVWFKQRGLSEKMWVKILKGSRLKGEGKIDNVPQILTKLRLHQLVKFKTDVEGITWGR